MTGGISYAFVPQSSVVRLSRPVRRTRDRRRTLRADLGVLVPARCGPGVASGCEAGDLFSLGPYTVPAFATEWYPRNMFLEGNAVNKHHKKTYALVKRQSDHPGICSNARGYKRLGAQCDHWNFHPPAATIAVPQTDLVSNPGGLISVMDKNFNVITYAVSSIVKAVIMDSRLPEKGRFLSVLRKNQYEGKKR